MLEWSLYQEQPWFLIQTYTHKQTHTSYPRVQCFPTGCEIERFEKSHAILTSGKSLKDAPLHALLPCLGPWPIHLQQSALCTNSYQNHWLTHRWDFQTKISQNNTSLIVPKHAERWFYNLFSFIWWSSTCGIIYLYSFFLFLPHLTYLVLSPTVLEKINKMRVGMLPGHFN